MKFGFLSMFMLRGGNDFCERVPEEKLRHLRKVGIQVIKRKDYEQALRCYSALVQLYEGLPGQKMAWYRMQCGITLAECHMHLGNTEEAIARFSDVIDEFPIIDTFVHNDENSDQHDEQEDKQISAVEEGMINIGSCHERGTKEKRDISASINAFNDDGNFNDEEIEMLRYSIGKYTFLIFTSGNDKSNWFHVGETYCKRAIAFQSLGLSKFSVFDLNVAIEHSPFDERKFFLLDQAKGNAGILTFAHYIIILSGTLFDGLVVQYQYMKLILFVVV